MIKNRTDGEEISGDGNWRRRVGNGLKFSLAVCGLLLTLVASVFAQEKVGIGPFKVFGSHEFQYLQDAIPHMLFSRLPYSAKEVPGRDALKNVLKGFENKDDFAQARRIVEAFDYQYLVIGTYTRMGDAFSLDVKVLKKGGTDFKTFYVSMDKENKVFSAVDELSRQIASFMGEGALGPKSAAIGMTVTTGAKEAAAGKDVKKSGNAFEKLKSIELDYSPTAGICLADIDGNGEKEVITGGRGTISVYRMDDTGLNLVYSYNLSGYQILSLNAGDFNKNGKDELYVTALYLDDAVTVVFEGTRGDLLQRQSETDWYVRVINHPSEGDLLLGQKMGRTDAFDGEIYRLGYNASGILAKNPFELTVKTNLYRIQPIRYKGQSMFAFFDDDDYLKIMDVRGKVLERLTNQYGGSIQGISKGGNREGKKFFPLFLRMIRSKDGYTDPLYVLKNEGSRLFAGFKRFSKGQVVYLKFDGINYREAVVSEIIDGYLSDFALNETDGKIYVSMVTENKGGRILIFQIRNSS